MPALRKYHRSRDKAIVRAIGCGKRTGQEAGMSRLSRTVFITLAALIAAATGSTALLAQTKPKITTLGPDFPKTEIFIGNSFFYYNNSMHSHVLGLERAADLAHTQDYRATSVTISGSGVDWHDVEPRGADGHREIGRANG